MAVWIPTTRAVSSALGKHFYQFYKGREDLFRIVIPFLRSGLGGGEACVWIVSQQVGVLEVVEAIRREFDLTPFIENSQLLILPAERWYLEGGRFSARKARKNLRNLVRDKQQLGFKAFRGIADLGWLEEQDWERFQNYEKEIHDVIQGMPAIGLCAYPIQHCTLTQTKEVLECHDSVFLSKP